MRDYPMPTEKEKRIDNLIDKYNVHRLTQPKLNLSEISAENREFLIACIDETTDSFTLQNGVMPKHDYVFFGSWNNLNSSQNKNFRNITWYKCVLQHDCKDIDL